MLILVKIWLDYLSSLCKLLLFGVHVCVKGWNNCFHEGDSVMNVILSNYYCQYENTNNINAIDSLFIILKILSNQDVYIIRHS